MKKAFVLLLDFLLYLIFSTLLFLLIFVIYKNCVYTAFGNRGFYFSFPECVGFCLAVLPVSVLVSICGVFLKCAATKNFFWGSALVIVFIVLVSFGGIIPLSFAAQNRLSAGDGRIVRQKDISRYNEKTFVKIDNDLYYFTNITSEQGAGLRKVNYDERKFFESYKNKPLSVSDTPESQQAVFAESLSVPVFVSAVQKIIMKFIACARNSWNGGWVSYLAFALIAVGLFSLWGILFFTSWKLLDGLFMWAGFMVVCGLNYLLMTPSFFDNVRTFLAQKLGAAAASPVAMSAALNLLLLIVFSLGGLFSYIFQRKKYAGTEI